MKTPVDPVNVLRTAGQAERWTKKMNARKFSFEYTHTFTEDEFYELYSIIKKKNRPIARVIVALVGIACFSTPYTFVVGVIIFGLIILSLFTNKITKLGYGRTFTESKLLKMAITYGVSESELWLHSQSAEARIKWNMIRHWEAKDPWLFITCANMPTFYLKIDELRERGYLDDVVALCNKHAIPYQSKEMKDLSNQRVDLTR